MPIVREKCLSDNIIGSLRCHVPKVGVKMHVFHRSFSTYRKLGAQLERFICFWKFSSETGQGTYRGYVWEC